MFQAAKLWPIYVIWCGGTQGYAIWGCGASGDDQVLEIDHLLVISPSWSRLRAAVLGAEEDRLNLPTARVQEILGASRAGVRQEAVRSDYRLVRATLNADPRHWREDRVAEVLHPLNLLWDVVNQFDMKEVRDSMIAPSPLGILMNNLTTTSDPPSAVRGVDLVAVRHQYDAVVERVGPRWRRV